MLCFTVCVCCALLSCVPVSVLFDLDPCGVRGVSQLVQDTLTSHTLSSMFVLLR